MNFADVKTLNETIAHAKLLNIDFAVPENSQPNQQTKKIDSWANYDGYEILNNSYSFDEEDEQAQKKAHSYGKALFCTSFFVNSFSHD